MDGWFGGSLRSGEAKVSNWRITMLQKEQVIDFKVVKGVRFAKLPFSQFEIAGLATYAQISGGASLPLYFPVAQSATPAAIMTRLEWTYIRIRYTCTSKHADFEQVNQRYIDRVIY